jgi:hypothetical protein
MSLVISYIFFGWSPTGIDVIPGKSTIVKFGHELEKIFNIIGLSIISFFEPQTFYVT